MEIIREEKKTMVYKYSWKYNQPVKAEVAAERFRDLEEKTGKLSAGDLLDSARPVEDEMHPCFEWNDGIAAEKWRMQQSRTLIGNLVCVAVTEEEEKPQPVRAYVNIAEHKNEGSYIGIVRALSDQEKRRAVFKRAMAELETFKEKYKSLSEFERIIGLIEELEEGV